MTDVAGRNGRRCLALLVVGLLLVTVATTSMNWVKYVSLRSTFAYDLGFYHNTAFNYARGHLITYVLNRAWFDPDDHNGPSVFRSNHFSPMGLFLVPQLYRVWPHIGTLFFLQSLVVALGALPLFFFVVQRTRAPRLGLLLALSYLLHPAILHTAFNDYRPVHLGIALALFALWFHASRRPLPFVAAALLMLACRPEYTFVLAAFGLINWRVAASPDRRVRWALAPLLLAALWAVLTNAYYLYFYGRPWPIALAVTGASQGPLLVPLLGRVAVFFRLALLPAVVGLLVPEALVVALPFVAAAKTVQWPAFPHHNLQHLSPALAVVFWAFACALVRLWPWLLRHRPRVVWAHGVLLAAALVSVAEFGWGAAQTYLVGGFPRYDEITRANAALPADATVLVPRGLVARFSAHTRVITDIPLPMGTSAPLSVDELKTIFTELISMCDLVVTEYGKEGITALILQSGRYRPAQIVHRYHIFVAREDAPRPSNPDARLQQILRWDQMSMTKRRWAGLVAE